MSRKNQLKNNKTQQKGYFTLSCRTWLINVAILMYLIANGIPKTNAVPTDSTGAGVVRTHLLQRALRDVTAIAASLIQEEPKDTRASATALYGSGGHMPPSASGGGAAATLDEASSSIQPQGQCLLDGVFVAETTVYCEKQVGCRALQKTGHCCPDYKCDCEKDGKTYSNGDKLVDPETPCTVCYCQGGEILCSSVTCFHRDDCTPKYIAGRCCPDYDNCPVSSPDPNTNANKTITDAYNAQTATKPEVPVAAMNPKITIKEITKPIEIRITDENKAIPIHQMLKPTTSTSTTEARTVIATTTTTTAAAAAAATKTPIASTTAQVAMVGGNDDLSSIKLSPIQENSSVETNRIKSNGGVNNESLKLKASVAYESTELLQGTGTPKLQQHFDTTQKIAMVDRSDEQQFGVFDTTGLQHVENESSSDSASKINIKREFLGVTEGAPLAVSSTTAVPNFDELGELLHASSRESVGSSGQTENLVLNSGEASEPDTAGSDNIYHIILTTDGPRLGSSTESYLALKGSASTESPKSAFEDGTSSNKEELNAIAEQQATPNTTEGVLNSESSTVAKKTGNEHHNQNLDISTEGMPESSTITSESNPMPSSTEGPHQHQHQHHSTDDDDTAIQVESNPAYPSLPEDDFSLREMSFPLSDTDDLGESNLKDESRSIASDAIKSTKQLDETLQQHISSGELGSGDVGIAISYHHDSPTTDRIEVSSTTAKIALMFSAEDTSAETAVSNSSDFRMNTFMKESENETGSGDSLEMEATDFFMGVSGSGSGAGADFAMASSSSMVRGKSEKQKKREPTTARPKRKLDVLDIDEELGSASAPLSPEDDPKLDVESLKLDENQVNDVIKTDAAIATNAAQDKTLADGPGGELLFVVGDQEGVERVQRLYLQRVY